MKIEEVIAGRIEAAATVHDLALTLERLLGGGYAVWTDGTLYHARQRVDSVNGLRIEIYPREHAPPHFHVVSGDLRASFAIDDCRLLEGDIASRDRALVRWWHQHSRRKLIEVWNATRPTDCPVGQIVD